MLLNYHHEYNDYVGSLDWIGRHEHVSTSMDFVQMALPSGGTRTMTADGRAIAAIDIGSNTLKLTVARVSNGQVTPIAGTAEVVRLSARDSERPAGSATTAFNSPSMCCVISKRSLASSTPGQ